MNGEHEFDGYKVNCTVCGKITTYGEASSEFGIVACPDCKDRVIVFLRGMVSKGELVIEPLCKNCNSKLTRIATSVNKNYIAYVCTHCGIRVTIDVVTGEVVE